MTTVRLHRLIYPLLIALLLLLGIFPANLTNAQDNGVQTKIIIAPGDRVSIILPVSWRTSILDENENLLLFASSQSALEQTQTFWSSDAFQPINGAGGLILTTETAQINSYDLQSDSVSNLAAFLQASDNIGQIQAPFPWKNGAVAVVDWGSQRGYLGIMPVTDTEIAIIFTGTEQPAFNVQRQSLYAILDTVSLPPSSFGVLVTSDKFSVELPEDWFFNDQIVDNEIFYYGATESDIEDRITFWEEDDTWPASGPGGFFVEFQPGTLSFLDPTKSIMTNMDAFLNNIDNTLIQDPRPLSLDGYSASYVALEWSSQTGYLTLINLEESGWILNFFTDTADQLEANGPLNLRIIRSFHYPALNFRATDSIPPVVVRNPEETLEFQVPGHWTFRAEEGAVQRLYFAATSDELNRMIGEAIPRNAGGAILLDNRSPGNDSIEELFASNIPETGLTFFNHQQAEFNDYIVMWAEFSSEETRGYWAVMNLGTRVAVVVLRTPPDQWQERPDFEALLQSIRYEESGF